MCQFFVYIANRRSKQLNEVSMVSPVKQPVRKSVKLVIRHLRKSGQKQIVGLRFSFTYLRISHRDIKQKQREMCIWLLFPAILSE